jgi:hypothetical protein
MTFSRFFTNFAAAGVALLAAVLLNGCQSLPSGNPNPVAYRPKNPANVRVKVSLAKQQIYVMEGERPLLVAATCIGLPSKPTPRGHFTVTGKIASKRSGSYGFYRSGGRVVPAEAGRGSGEYIGYPMPFWVEFAPGYGFHQGYVWPVPRTHGCLRLHQNVAPKFFELVRVGTPVDIAQTQPEDATIGANVPRPTDYNDPDPAPELMVSSAAFAKPAGPLLKD